MNTSSFTRNPFYHALRGRAFQRLNPKAVETFHLAACRDCEAAISVNRLTLTEEKDDVLIEHGLTLLAAPQSGIMLSAHGPTLCSTCYQRWLDPTKASHEQLETI